MNSALQVLYMNPILRQIILDLPLCDGHIEIPTDFVEQGSQKHLILLTIQKLFTQLFKYDIRAVETTDLTTAFRWDSSEGRYQQDSQEFVRLFLFDMLERALMGTPYDGVINNLFK
jgi:hypothetical protein